MNTKFDFGPELTEKIVYVRPIAVAELPKEIRTQAQGIEILYSVHDENGERLALVRDRGLAFALARQNDFAPVSVH